MSQFLKTRINKKNILNYLLQIFEVFLHQLCLLFKKSKYSRHKSLGDLCIKENCISFRTNLSILNVFRHKF